MKTGMKQRITTTVVVVLFTALPLQAFQSITAVPRIALKDFDQDASYQDRPLIIETGLDVESICDTLMEQVSDKVITLQQTIRTYKKQPKEGNSKKNSYQPKSKKKQRRQQAKPKKVVAEKETKLYNLPMDQAIDLVMHQSNHDSSLFSFCEGLLDDDLSTTTTTMVDYTGKGSIRNKGGSITAVLDWFELFPPHLQPSDCVILAGEGASSTLHRDPFEWTGTSLCLEGSKVWRFLEPPLDGGGVERIDTLLNSYRLPSTAWEDGDTCLSAGWQSNGNLYEHRHPSIPSAQEILAKDMEEIAQNESLLQPSNNLDVNESCSCWTVVQKPGDLLLIPAHWWHQTYALEPSLAVASQRCLSKLDAARVVEHILSTTDTMENAPDLLLQGDYSDFTKKEEIQEVIDTLLDYLGSALDDDGE